MSSELNTNSYIDYRLQPMNTSQILNDQSPKFRTSLSISLRMLYSGRKWVIFLLISLLPMMISILAGDPLFGNDTPKAAFVDFFIGIFFLFLFGWGALLVSLPLSADDISDNMIDLYLVRPIRRDVLWISRWVANLIGLFSLNALIATIYYFYIHLADTPDDLNKNLAVLGNTYVFIALAAFTYGGLYLVVGSIGDKGFTFGVILAIFEPYFLSLLFLQESRYIPRNNLLRLADGIYGASLDVEGELINLPSTLTNLWALLYVFIFAIILIFIGIRNFSRREFH